MSWSVFLLFIHIQLIHLEEYVQKKELTRIEKENMYNRQTGRDNIYGDGI